MITTDDDQTLHEALSRDPPVNDEAPALTLPVAIPSGGVNLNAVLYVAAGAGPHPTVLLLHGLPGNEQNVDLAQSMRRAGWNVLTFHYRGSWGTPGTFSFAHCIEDGAAALEWLEGSGNEEIVTIDPRRIVIIGHSMGGFLAAHLMSERSEIAGGAMISGVDLGRYFGHGDTSDAERVDENVGYCAGLHILSGTSAENLAAEATSSGERWRLANYAPRIGDRPLLMITSDDGFAGGSDALADVIQEMDSPDLKRSHLPADHSYSAHRIALQTTVLRWLMYLSDSKHSYASPP